MPRETVRVKMQFNSSWFGLSNRCGAQVCMMGAWQWCRAGVGAGVAKMCHGHSCGHRPSFHPLTRVTPPSMAPQFSTMALTSGSTAGSVMGSRKEGCVLVLFTRTVCRHRRVKHSGDACVSHYGWCLWGAGAWKF